MSESTAEESYKELPVRAFETVDEWREWLGENHAAAAGIWVKFAKKGSSERTITYEEARDTAIAHGWIDGLINRYDEQFYLTRFTPRKAKSTWSKINCEVAEAIMALGAMHPAGLAQVEAAKRDGRWELAYDSPSKMAVSEDFQGALDHSPEAARYFASLNAANRYSFLYRIQTAKTPKTREERIKKFIRMLEARECFHPNAK